MEGGNDNDGSVEYESDHEDLIVFEDSRSLLTDQHRHMANTGSFTVARGHYDKPVDIYAVSTPQEVL